MAALTDPIHQIQTLAALFSQTFPIGAFSYSHGIESAIATGKIYDFNTSYDWVKTCLIGGSGHNDAILMANTYNTAKDESSDHGITDEIRAINELSFALCSGAERAQESRELGDNFVRTVDQIYQLGLEQSSPLAYPVAAGLTVRYLGCDLKLGLTFFLQGFVSNLISVLVRSVPIGQSDGQIMLARLMPAMAKLAEEAETATLDDVGGYAILADHASILHETLEPRIYRT